MKCLKAEQPSFSQRLQNVTKTLRTERKTHTYREAEAVTWTTVISHGMQNSQVPVLGRYPLSTAWRLEEKLVTDNQDPSRGSLSM